MWDALVLCRGQVIKGQEAVARSRYDEDVYPGDHTSVWGSYWSDGRWGYACCKSHLKNALCMGNRVEQVAQQQQSRRTDAVEQSGDKLGAQHDAAEPNSDATANGASDAGAVPPPLPPVHSERLWLAVYASVYTISMHGAKVKHACAGHALFRGCNHRPSASHGYLWDAFVQSQRGVLQRDAVVGR